MPTSAQRTGRAVAAIGGFQQGQQARVEAKERKLKGEQKLLETQQATEKFTSEQEEAQLRIQKLELDNQTVQAELSKTKEFEAFRAYSADGDVEHLNKMMTKTPMLKDMYSSVTSVAKIDPEADINLIRDSKYNLDPEMFFDPEIGPALKNRFLKITQPNGNKLIVDMQQKYAGSGYTEHLSKQELEKLLTESKITKGIDKEFKPPTSITEAKEEGRILDKQAAGETLTNAEESFLRGQKKRRAGTKPGQLAEAEDRTESLLNKFGGEDKFFETDFGDPKNFRKAHSDIVAIELLEDQQFTSTEKTQLNDISQLIALGDPSKTITAAETGVYDNFLFNTKKFIFEEVSDNVAATSAYSAFRNTVRHALFGSALTPAEIKAFNEAFGTLKQKLGPVLQQFQTSLGQVKAKLSSISRMKNPYSAKVRLGVDQVEIDRIISSIDSRIDFLNRSVSEDPTRRSRLDKIMTPNLGTTK